MEEITYTSDMYLRSNLHVDKIHSEGARSVNSLILKAAHTCSSIAVCGKIGGLFFVFRLPCGRKNVRLRLPSEIQNFLQNISKS
jgi:hypothetical protein